MRAEAQTNQTEAIGSENHENRANTSSTGHVALNKVNQTKNEFQVLLQTNDDATDKRILKNVSTFENKLVHDLYGIKDSIKSTLA